jgi:hypothetical protein
MALSWKSLNLALHSMIDGRPYLLRFDSGDVSRTFLGDLSRPRVMWPWPLNSSGSYIEDTRMTHYRHNQHKPSARTTHPGERHR